MILFVEIFANVEQTFLQKFETIIFKMIIYYIEISFYPTIQPQISSKKNLNNVGIKTVSNSTKTIRNSINNENNNTHIKSRLGVYEIPCLDCNKNMWGNLLVVLKNEFKSTWEI